MSDVSQARIIIRHQRGSKANQVEQIPLKDLQDITIGRDPSSTIAFDSRRDDVVSRRHAAIRIEGGDNPTFRLSDLGSSNGTFLNGEAVTGEVELSPEDIIELGKGGPKFVFDVQPRPASWASRTRVIDPLDTTVTRAIAAVSGDAGATRDAAAFGGASGTVGATPGKAGVGKDTVLRMLNQQRKSTSRVWAGSLAAVIALLCVVGYGLYRRNEAVSSRVNEVEQQAQHITSDANNAVTAKLGMLATDINQKYANSTVFIHVQWRLYDQETGRPLFQKTVYDKSLKAYVPAFINTSKGILRWLTLEDEDKTNIPIMESATGSGFVVSDNGFILTNKHVAAGWMVPYDNIGQEDANIGYVYPYDYNPKDRKDKVDEVPLNSSIFDDLKEWYPEHGAYVFDANRPIKIGGGTQVAGDIGNARVFNGRDEVLEVRFPGNRMSLQATLVRASTDSDAAVIKIEAPQKLRAVELATDDKVQVGDRTFVLGYPAVSEKTYTITQSSEAGVSQTRLELIPEPTLTEGIVSHLGAPQRDQGGLKVRSSLDDAFQLSINSTGAGNSGGPVFNDRGHVIGLFTYARDVGGARVSFAVPIKYGLDLLELQRAGAN